MNPLLNSVNHTRRAVKWGLMVHTIVMFLFVTIYTAMNLNTQSLCYIDNRDFPGIDGRLPPEPHTYLFFIHSKANFIPSLMFTLNQWLTDGLVVSSVFNLLPRASNVAAPPALPLLCYLFHELLGHCIPLCDIPCHFGCVLSSPPSRRQDRRLTLPIQGWVAHGFTSWQRNPTLSN